METRSLLFLVSFVLLIVILLMLFMGCSCFTLPVGKEGFSNGPRISIANPEESKKRVEVEIEVEEDDDNGPVTLSTAETELFEDLRNNRLTSKQINDMVKAKILTTSVVEKFMKKLEENYQGETILNPLEKKQEEHEDVEGFCAEPSYASW